MQRVFNKHHGNAPPSAVYVGRPTEWGNPFSHLDDTTAEFRVASRDEAVSRYRDWLIARIDAEPGLLDRLKHELGGKDLVCWCAPHACHADVLMEMANPTTTTKAYAGIGSRETPQDVLETMRKIAGYLAGQGYTLRSGAASGADSAFEQGALAAGGKTEIWVPWRGFNQHPSGLMPSPEAFDLAAQTHPAWDACKQGAKALHARNGHQVLGADLERPVEFIVCWTKGGTGAGGTGQALRIAKNKGIEVYDLGKPGELERFRGRFTAARQPAAQEIRGFTGEYRWLSNFIGHPGTPTVEHLYQAAKASTAEGEEFVLAASSPSEAKKRGKEVSIRDDWEEVKVLTMRALLESKFNREPFRSKLLATGEAELIEENHWNDTFWGVCRGVGENRLGKLLMEIRSQLRQ